VLYKTQQQQVASGGAANNHASPLQEIKPYQRCSSAQKKGIL